MALPNTVSFNSLTVALGNGATPEVFVAPAGFTDKSYKIKIATGSTDVPDATDADLPMWQEIEAKTISAELTGSGVLAMADLTMWRTWYLSGTPKNVQITFPGNLAAGGGVDQFAAICTDFEVTAKKGEKCAISVTIESTGAITNTPAAA